MAYPNLLSRGLRAETEEDKDKPQPVNTLFSDRGFRKEISIQYGNMRQGKREKPDKRVKTLQLVVKLPLGT